MDNSPLAPKLTFRENSLRNQLTLGSMQSTPLMSTRRGTIIRGEAEHLAKDVRAMRFLEKDYGVNPITGEVLTSKI